MEKNDLIAQGYIPLDKSWHIRMGVLDLLTGMKDTIMFLEQFMKKRELSYDLESLYQSSVVWSHGSRCVYVGESGTLYRFLRFADWYLGGKKEFGVSGTLKERRKEMCQDPDIVNWNLEELLKLDHRTSQWASAAVICSEVFDDYNIERIETDRDKLNLTYEAVDHWKEKMAKGERWEIRYDDTLATQAVAYLELLKTGEMEFMPEHAEDYCFARAFGIIHADDAEHYRARWSSLEGHESKRIDEMEKALSQYSSGEIVDSRDHRVVQAVAMLAKYDGKKARFEYRKCVGKSWPEFWKFLEDSRKLAA